MDSPRRTCHAPPSQLHCSHPHISVRLLLKSVAVALWRARCNGTQVSRSFTASLALDPALRGPGADTKSEILAAASALTQATGPVVTRPLAALGHFPRFAHSPALHTAPQPHTAQVEAILELQRALSAASVHKAACSVPCRAAAQTCSEIGAGK